MKTSLTASLLLLAMALGAEAQCPVGEYIVRDQTNLNQFQVQWPQCESLDALNVREATAHDLGPLSKIKTIKGNAVFDHCLNLQGISGMIALKEIGGTLTIDDMDSILDFSGLETLERIGGDFKVVANSRLASFKGLFSLKDIGGKLEITDNENLSTLLESSSLLYLGLTPKSDLIIQRNEKLLDVKGLQAIKEVKGKLTVQSNKSLQNLDGLSGIGLIDSSIYIVSNNALENLDGLRNLETCNFKIDIGLNPKLKSINLPGLKKAGTRISFYENVEMRSIKGMNSLLKFDGDLYIQRNYKLDTILAFNNLREGGTLIVIETNGAIPDFGFLGKLKKLPGSLQLSAAFPVPGTGLDSLSYVGVDLMLSNHFHTLGGLERLEYVGRRFIISADSLENVSALTKLDTVRELTIQGSRKLVSLAGIENVNAVAMGQLMITTNPKLTHCSVKSVCDFQKGPGNLYVSSNTGNCKDTAAVRKSCEDPSGILTAGLTRPELRTTLESNSGEMEVRFRQAKRPGIRVFDTKGRTRAIKRD